MKGQVDLLKNEVRDKELVESALEDMGGELEGVEAALTAAFEQCVLQLHANADSAVAGHASNLRQGSAESRR